MNRKIAVVMGSDSDYEKLKPMLPILRESGIDYEFRVISAHRTPEIAADFARNAKIGGYDVIIACAGMSAHLAGVLAAFTGVPIIGLPIKSTSSGMDGMDALHSIIQMPPGIPVATVGIDHAEGAAKLAVKMMNCRSDKGRESIVKLLHSKNEGDEAALEKTVKALDVYGIGYEIIDLTFVKRKDGASDYDAAEPDEVVKQLKLSRGGNTFAFLNLTDINIEKIIESEECEKNTPIIEVPLKATTNGFNDTSNKIYYRTQRAGSVAFTGVNAYQNAGHLIARIVGISDQEVYDKVVSEHSKLAAAVVEKDAKMREGKSF